MGSRAAVQGHQAQAIRRAGDENVRHRTPFWMIRRASFRLISTAQPSCAASGREPEVFSPQHPLCRGKPQGQSGAARGDRGHHMLIYPLSRDIRLRSRSPGPPRFSSMNSTPTRSYVVKKLLAQTHRDLIANIQWRNLRRLAICWAFPRRRRSRLALSKDR
jgi:hypothetical protein